MKASKMLANKEKSSEQRLNLMKQARDGNKGAMENLTMNDMDLYSSLSRRVMKEDVLSIVESSFIPYGNIISGNDRPPFHIINMFLDKTQLFFKITVFSTQEKPWNRQIQKGKNGKS